MTDLRNQVAQVAADANQPRLHTGYLAEDYDGIGQYVAVALSRGSASAAMAHVAAGAFASDQITPAGTAVTVVSKYGQLEVISLGSKISTTISPDSESSSDWTTNQDTADSQPVRLVTPAVVDLSGSQVIGADGFGGAWRKLFTSGGVYNSDFEMLPPEPNSELAELNLPPYWDFLTLGGSGTHLQVINSNLPGSGYILRATRDGGSSSTYAWLGQLLPISRAVTVEVQGKMGPLAMATAMLDIILDWYDQDLQFISRGGGGRLASIWDADTYFTDLRPSGNPPERAAFLLVWVGIRDYSADATTKYFDILSVGINAVFGSGYIQLPDTDPDITDGSYGEITAFARSLRLYANTAGGAGSQPSMIIDGDNGVIWQSDMEVGTISITPVANKPTSGTVSGLTLTGSSFMAVASARSTVPGSSVMEVSVGSPSSSGVTLWLYRDNTTSTGIDYMIKAKYT